MPEFGVTQGLYKPDHNNFAPRFGFAWSPVRLGGKQTVLRGGYGIFFNMPQMQVYTLMGNNPPASLTESFNVAEGKRLTLANGFPGSGTLPAFPAILPIADDYKPGYVQSWTFGIQQEIFRSTVLEVGYVGSKSTRLDQTETLNMPTPGPGLTSYAVRIRTSAPSASFRAIPMLPITDCRRASSAIAAWADAACRVHFFEDDRR